MIGSILGIISGILLAVSIFFVQPLKLAFADWNIPFLGPFMSMALLEAIIVILASVLVLTRSLASDKNRPVSTVLLSIIGMVYGISLFVGAFLLSFSLLNIVWKGPWLPPLLGKPGWLFSVVILWSASLVMLEIGGFVLILLSCLGFVSAAKDLFAEPGQGSSQKTLA
jgi:hypothetical protein